MHPRQVTAGVPHHEREIRKRRDEMTTTNRGDMGEHCRRKAGPHQVGTDVE
jgi:hypothetical protein